MHNLWMGAWLAAMIVGVAGLGPDRLRVREVLSPFRRRDPGADPLQPADRDPLHGRPGRDGAGLLLLHRTVQNEVLAHADANGTPDHEVTVVGSSGPGRSTTTRTPRSTARPPSTTAGTTADRPTLYLPVNKSVDFQLRSPDVIHSFWVPAFLFKMDVIPGRRQPLQLSPRRARARSRAGAPSCAGSTTRGCCSTSRSSTDVVRRRTSRSSQRGATSAGPAAASLADAEAGQDERQHGGASDRRLRAAPARRSEPQPHTLGQDAKVITTTDHKLIGKLYLGTAFAWFLIAGLMAMLIRSELASPGSRSSTTSSTTSCSRCTARSCCCCSRRRCSSGSPT